MADLSYNDIKTNKPAAADGSGGLAFAGTAMKVKKIVANGDGVVKAEPGVYFGYWCQAITGGGNLNVYDNASAGSGETLQPAVASIAAGNPTFPFGDKGVVCSNGITINLSAGTGIVLYVYYR